MESTPVMSQAVAATGPMHQTGPNLSTRRQHPRSRYVKVRQRRWMKECKSRKKPDQQQKKTHAATDTISRKPVCVSEHLDIPDDATPIFVDLSAPFLPHDFLMAIRTESDETSPISDENYIDGSDRWFHYME